jgi:hypothetical protein
MSVTISVIALVFSAASLLISGATFANNVLVKVDDLKLMVTNGPQMGGTRQGLTVTTTDTLMTFINMGNRPIAITSLNLLVEETDGVGKLLHSGQIGWQFQVQPFIIKAGEILTKEVSISDNPLTFKPAETSGSETIKLRAGFWLVTPDSSTYASTDLLSNFSLPPSGASQSVTIVVVPREGAATFSPTTTLYHNRSVALPW